MASRESPRQLGRRHGGVRRLRELLRDPRARRREQAFVLEGPRVVAGALARGVRLDALYLGTGAATAFGDLVDAARRSGAAVNELAEGVLESVGDTATPQPVLGVAGIPRTALEDLARGLILVVDDLADPGNAGTLLRSAEATGAAGVVFAGSSVDPYNPKAVRASAGAIVGTPVVVHDATVEVLEVLGRQGRQLVGATAWGGTPSFSTSWPAECAIVLGNETHGLAPEVKARLDETVTIPMVAGESLNVGMAATVLAYAWMQEQAS